MYSRKFFYKRRTNICSGELLLYTVWFLLELILCGTNIQSHYKVTMVSSTNKTDQPINVSLR